MREIGAGFGALGIDAARVPAEISAWSCFQKERAVFQAVGSRF